jgi:hypothetical protein
MFQIPDIGAQGNRRKSAGFARCQNLRLQHIECGAECDDEMCASVEEGNQKIQRWSLEYFVSICESQLGYL